MFCIKFCRMFIIPSKFQKAQIAWFKPFLVEGCTFPIERIQSLMLAYMGQQGRLFVAHHINHQLHAKSESGDKHIPLWDGKYVGDLLRKFV